MRDYLEKTLRQPVDVKKNSNLYRKLPLVYRGRYEFYDIEVGKADFVAIVPQTSVGLITMRKDIKLIEKELNANCAFVFESVTFYIKEKLLDEGIPYVVIDKQIYLPFLGYALSKNDARDLPRVDTISYLTQKLLLTAIYNKWEDVTVSEAGRRLGVTKMSLSRCFDELEVLGINILGIKGKSRVITVQKDKKLLWEDLQRVLRNPVITRYEFTEDIMLRNKAGVTALCEYSLMSDNAYPTYAILKKELKDLNLKSYRRARSEDEIGCVVLELGYFIDFDGKNFEDPLSVALTLTDEEMQDERVAISVDSMLEEYVWSLD